MTLTSALMYVVTDQASIDPVLITLAGDNLTSSVGADSRAGEADKVGEDNKAGAVVCTIHSIPHSICLLSIYLVDGHSQIQISHFQEATKLLAQVPNALNM